jgi:hypothetical protein
VWWEHRGPTDLEHLAVICLFDHRLFNGYGWAVRWDRDGTVRWFHPDGTPYRAGPMPPEEKIDRQAELAAVNF